MTSTFLSYENQLFLRRNQVTLSNPFGNTDPQFPLENTLDNLTWSRSYAVAGSDAFYIIYDFGQNILVDCAGIAGHNLHLVPEDAVTPPDFSVDYSTNGTDYTLWKSFQRPFTPNAIFWSDRGSAVAARYFRFRLVGGPLPIVPGSDPGLNLGPGFAVGWIGNDIEFPRNVEPPLRPPGWNYQNRLLQNFGGGGQLLGTGVLWQGGQSTFRFRDLPWSFWEQEETQRAYAAVIRGEPFMFAWDNDEHEEQAGYCVAPQNPIVEYRSHSRLDFSVTAWTM